MKISAVILCRCIYATGMKIILILGFSPDDVYTTFKSTPISNTSASLVNLIKFAGFLIFGRKFIAMRTDKKVVLNDLSVLLRTRFADNLKEVVLFGSQASGKANRDSDYDFLIILKQKADWKTEREISDLCYEIDLKYNIITDTHILSESEFVTLRGKQPIFVNAMSKGIHA